MPYNDPELKRLNRIKHAKKNAELTKKWIEAHPEKRKEYRDRHKNKDIDKFREEENARRRKRRAECPWVRTYEGIYTRIRQGKQGRKRCLAYANVKMLMNPAQLKELWLRDKGSELKNPSIDRIDPDGDYSFENCRYIELSENRLRNRRWHVPR